MKSEEQLAAERAKGRARSAAYVERNRDEVNARKRAAYWLNIERSREQLRKRMRERYAANPAYRSMVANAARKCHLWKMYRLKPEDYSKIEEYQGGVCAVCNKLSEKVRLAVDHCHKTGLIRGLLCWECNRALGFIRDRKEVAEALALYLKEPTAPAALGKETYGLIGKAKSKKKMVYGPPEVAVVVRKGSSKCLTLPLL